MTQSIGPFVERFEPPVTAETPATDLLSGLTVAVKDNFDIAGTVTGGGNPEWAEDQAPAARHASAVQTLLENGAALVGKVHMDELAYSLMGVNARFGTPENPAAPSRVPGGSSSGSASAVASGLADIGALMTTLFPREYPHTNLAMETAMILLQEEGLSQDMQGVLYGAAMTDFIINDCPDCNREFTARNNVFTVGTASTPYSLNCT